MRLADYLSSTNTTDDEFAKAIGVSVFGVRKWKYGERVPRPDQMRLIAEFTKGRVSPNDFILPASKDPPRIHRSSEAAA